MKSTLEQYRPTSASLYRSEVVGHDKNGRKIRKGTEYYETPSGLIEIGKWTELVTEAAVAEGLGDLLEGIKEHVRQNCAWFHANDDISQYAAECLIHEAYKHWEGFSYQQGLF